MGQKVHPIGFRLGVTRTWDSRWYAKKDYAKLLHEDLKLRDELKKKLYAAGIAKIEIERAANKVKINVHTARPGIVIGKKGAGVDQLRAEIQKFSSSEILLNIIEVKNPEANAQLISENVGAQLEKRVAFRRAMKKCMTAAFKQGIKGIKIRVAGRLGGAEIARAEWYSEDSVPLHTLRANVDYGTAQAKTVYGVIGIKVWVYHGETQTLKRQAALDAKALLANGGEARPEKRN
ncbi:MAG: 30S ribosomal protein S3 [Bdellovibrionales bacterium]|nr:30S ribosomal protein S3 [Bdellovibrionales bacterium]